MFSSKPTLRRSASRSLREGLHVDDEAARLHFDSGQLRRQCGTRGFSMGLLMITSCSVLRLSLRRRGAKERFRARAELIEHGMSRSEATHASRRRLSWMLCEHRKESASLEAGRFVLDAHDAVGTGRSAHSPGQKRRDEGKSAQFKRPLTQAVTLRGASESRHVSARCGASLSGPLRDAEGCVGFPT